MKANDALAFALSQEAQGPIFGLMGDANMPLWGSLMKQPDQRLVWSRHDAAAVLMADGYVNATGKLGVATVTCGPGLANSANAILTASRSRSPLVIFTGEYPMDGGKGGLQALDQRRFAAACETEFQPLDRLETLAEDIAEGFYTARMRSRPVILNMPQALWEADLKWGFEYRPSFEFIPEPPAPAPTQIRRVAQMLRQAERPVFVAGRGAALSGAAGAIVKLADQTGALLATSLLAKGFFDGHPYNVGIAGSFSSAVTERLMSEADLVLGIGASLNFFTTEGGMLFPNANVVRIDLEPYAPSIGYTPGLHLTGDARATVEALLDACQDVENKDGFRTPETQAVLDSVVEQPEAATDGIDPRQLMRTLSSLLPPRTQVVSGAGHFWSWPICHLALPAGGRYQHTAAFGSIGLGLAHAIGAAVGNPDRPTLLIEGDGSLLQAVEELHAAVEQKIPLIVLIMNDSGYGAEVLKMTWKDRDPRDARWASPDFAALARAFGGSGVAIDAIDELPDAIARALECGGPFVIDARISPTMVSDSYSRAFLGAQNRIPLLRSAN